MGCVYEGVDTVTGQRVAVKMMSNQVTCFPEYRTLFKSEAEALKQMDHPSVVHIMGEPFSDPRGNLYLPMEFVDGLTLDKYLQQHGPLVESDAIGVMTKILDAMQYVHDHGQIHRDIKPSNIILRPDGSVCIIDFGIAKDAQVGATGKTVGRIIGTDGYMSPEQASGLNIDKRTDIYSLGCVLFFLLTGQHAIVQQANNIATIRAILNTTLMPPSKLVAGISAHIDQVFLKSVDKNMTRRYPSAAAFKAALNEIPAKNGDPAQLHEMLLVDRPITEVPVRNGNLAAVSVGKSADNDIVIDNEYVSGRHLIIRGGQHTVLDGMQRATIEIEDMSTNGTGLDGRLLRHATETIEYSDTDQLPEVLLAGRPECVLDWPAVTALLKSRGWHSTADTPLSDTSDTTGGNIGIVRTVLSLLVPPVGWMIFYSNKSSRPACAKQAATLGWFGLTIYLFTILLLMG